MYKFTNGVVVYDEATRDKYINSGMTLVEEPKKEEKEIGESEIKSEPKRDELRRTTKKTSKFSRSFK